MKNILFQLSNIKLVLILITLESFSSIMILILFISSNIKHIWCLPIFISTNLYLFFSSNS